MSAEQLDELFAQTAEACRRWLLAWNAARPVPSRASTTAHDRLMESHNELEALVAEIAEVFE